MTNKKLSTTITIGGAISSSLRGAFGTVKKSTTEIGSAIKSLSSEQRQLNEAMKRYGHSAPVMERLNSRYSTIVGQVERLRKAQERLNAVERASAANLAKRAELRGQIFDTVALGAVVAAPLKVAADRETHAAGIAKQLQGARDEAGKLTQTFWNTRKAIVELGHTIPMATNDLLDMASAGLRMGIAGDAIADFTKNTSMLAAALELNPEETAERFGKLQTTYRLTSKQALELGDALNYVDDQSTARGGDIIDVLGRVGGSAGLINITAKSVVGYGAALLSMGETAETTGTALNKLFTTLSLGNKGTKAAQAVIRQLGFSPNEVAKSMQLDADKTMQVIFKKVAKLPKTKQLSALVDLFGVEAAPKLAKFVSSADQLTESLKNANGEAAKGSVLREYGNVVQTTNAQMVMLANRTADVADNIGTVLLPTVNDAAKIVGKFTTVVANFAQAHPAITKAVVGTVVALTSLKVATLATSYAFTFLRGGILRTAGVLAGARAQMALTAVSTRLMGTAAVTANGGLMGMATRAIPAVITGIRAVGVAFISTGIGAIVAGLALGGLAVYKNWSMVSSFFSGFGKGFSAAISPVIEKLTFLKPVIKVVGEYFDYLLNTGKKIIGWFTDLGEPVKYSAAELKKAGDAGEQFGKAFAKGIEVLTLPIQWLVDKITWVSGNIGELTKKAVEFKNSVTDTVGNAWQNTKDFFSNPFSDTTNDATVAAGRALPGTGPLPAPAMANRSGGNNYTTEQTNHFTINAAPGMNEDALARKVAATLKQQQSVRGRSMMPDGLAAP